MCIHVLLLTFLMQSFTLTATSDLCVATRSVRRELRRLSLRESADREEKKEGVICVVEGEMEGGREGGRDGGREGGRERGREGEREGEREGGMDGGRDGERKGWGEEGRDGGREGWSKGGRERGRGREGGNNKSTST